jgi:hypothetical protein
MKRARSVETPLYSAKTNEAWANPVAPIKQNRPMSEAKARSAARRLREARRLLASGVTRGGLRGDALVLVDGLDARWSAIGRPAGGLRRPAPWLVRPLEGAVAGRSASGIGAGKARQGQRGEQQAEVAQRDVGVAADQQQADDDAGEPAGDE